MYTVETIGVNNNFLVLKMNFAVVANISLSFSNTACFDEVFSDTSLYVYFTKTVITMHYVKFLQVKLVL